MVMQRDSRLLLTTRKAVNQYWRALGYRNRMAEWALYTLFLSGLLLWDLFSVPWPVLRVLLILHILCSIIVFPMYILPFWLSHRRLLKHSKKQFLVVTGNLLDALLLLCLASGLYLFIQGNRGDDLGYYAFLSHLIAALVLTPILMKHSARWSVLKPVWLLVTRVGMALKSFRLLRK